MVAGSVAVEQWGVLSVLLILNAFSHCGGVPDACTQFAPELAVLGKLFNLFVREVAREGVEEITCEALLELDFGGELHESLSLHSEYVAKPHGSALFYGADKIERSRSGGSFDVRAFAREAAKKP